LPIKFRLVQTLMVEISCDVAGLFGLGWGLEYHRTISHGRSFVALSLQLLLRLNAECAASCSAEVERRAFLRRLHTLISQPVVPGREADYLITQTMAEYLAHVHDEPFDGIMFKSVQREGGANVVLFGAKRSFPLEYVDQSLKLFATQAVQYTHRERRYYILDGGKVSLG